MIYFDNAATTRALPAVAEKMSTMLCEQYGNPASVSAMGLAAEKEIRNVAEIIARGIRCKYDEVFFTSGGTESDNWALKGTMRANEKKGRHLIISAIEHHAILHSAKALEREGFEVTVLPVDADGVVAPEALREKMGMRLIGCDICQRVCPMQPKFEAGKTLGLKLCALVTEDQSLFSAAIQKLSGEIGKNAARPQRVRAQAALLAGNSGDAKYLPVLESWANLPFEAVAEHARWAKERLSKAGLDRTNKTD